MRRGQQEREKNASAQQGPPRQAAHDIRVEAMKKAKIFYTQRQECDEPKETRKEGETERKKEKEQGMEKDSQGSEGEEDIWLDDTLDGAGNGHLEVLKCCL